MSRRFRMTRPYDQRRRRESWTNAAIALACGLILGAILIFASRPVEAHAYEAATIHKVSDGDTVRVNRQASAPVSEPVRLIGIDTPEVYFRQECGGREASAALKRLLTPGEAVRLSADSTQGKVDGFGRLLRYVTEREGRRRDAGLHMIRLGWARPYVYRRPFRQGKARQYFRAFKRAAENRRGVHGKCGGKFHKPLERVGGEEGG